MNRFELEQILTNTFNVGNNNQFSQLYRYYELIVESSKVMNLTTITDLDGVYIKHFYDSLLLGQAMDLKNIKSMIDIGSGAGMPGIIIAVMYPNINVTLLEPTGKRCNFLQKVVDELCLNNVKIVNDRAETYVKNNVNEREKYDVVTARAVANLNILVELCAAYVKVNGTFAAMKGQNYAEETAISNASLNLLGIKIANIKEFDLPLFMGKRAILIYKKDKNTSKNYPRMFSLIKKNPLQ